MVWPIILHRDVHILYLMFTYYWQIGIIRNNIVKLFDSIEKYGKLIPSHQGQEKNIFSS